MSAHLTRRQEEIWRKKMVELEKSLIWFYQKELEKNPAAVPDGSFCMNAFKSGLYLRRKP
jgi:hypothetical protein